MLGLLTDGCIVVSDCTLISILSVVVEALEMLWAKAADTLAPLVGDLKPESSSSFQSSLLGPDSNLSQRHSFLVLSLKILISHVIQLIVVLHNSPSQRPQLPSHVGHVPLLLS